jgi:hypothetical protein
MVTMSKLALSWAVLAPPSATRITGRIPPTALSVHVIRSFKDAVRECTSTCRSQQDEAADDGKGRAQNLRPRVRKVCPLQHGVTLRNRRHRSVYAAVSAVSPRNDMAPMIAWLVYYPPERRPGHRARRNGSFPARSMPIEETIPWRFNRTIFDRSYPTQRALFASRSRM